MPDLENRTKRHQIQGHLPTAVDGKIDRKKTPSTTRPDLYAEHKKCFWLVDDLNDALVEPKSKIDVQDQVRRLLALVTMHFRHEEALFALYGYLDGRCHCERHSAILAKSRQLSDELNKAISPVAWVKYGSLISRAVEEHLEEEQVIYEI